MELKCTFFGKLVQQEIQVDCFSSK